MTIEQLLKKYKRKYPGVPYEIEGTGGIVSQKNNKFHSYGDAPAYVSLYDEAKQWCKNGKLHRENDKPAVVYPNGEKKYFYNGKEYDPLYTSEKQKKQIERLTPKKSKKQKQRENLLKEFVKEIVK